MPLTTNKLRHFVKSKHPYVDRNLGSVVNIIRHSVQNSSSFEAVAQQLKEAQIQMVRHLLKLFGQCTSIENYIFLLSCSILELNVAVYRSQC